MMKTKILFSVSALLLIASSAFANDAGCGLGSLVMSKNSMVSQVSAATTNGTFGSQTFGITSGTSNCKASGFVMVNKEQIYYAESNYRELSVEMAKGQGETLAGLAQLFGCNEGSIKAFGSMTREKYETIFPSQNTLPSQMLDSVKKEIKANPNLSKDCQRVG